MSVAGAAGIAGCFGGSDDDGNGNGNGNGNGEDDDGMGEGEEEVDPLDIIEGGTLRVGLSANIDSFDPPYSTDTTSTLAQSLLYEGLTTSDSQGNIYPWLAESYELVDSDADIERLDYEPYMRTETVGEEGALNVDEQIIIHHPENVYEEGEEALILTTTEAAEAVDDGVFAMQYRYNIRQGVEFHNGDELTADDVVASYRRYENSDVSAQTYDSILHVRKVDEYTVDVYAQVPDAEAERELPGVSIVPEEHADLGGGELDPRQGTTPVGTGPYVFEEFEDNQYYIVSKNEDYWVEDVGIHSIDWFDGHEDFPNGPVIDEVDMDIIPDDSTRSAALQNDEIDITYGVASSTLSDFDAADDYRVAAVETGGYTFLQYPVNVEPWDDERIRQAVNHLIPRGQIVANIFDGWAREAWTPVPELAQGLGTTDPDQLEEDLRPRNEYDPARAEELVNEAADDLGIELPIEVQLETNEGNDDRVQMVNLVADAMEQTGLFETELETFEWNTYIARIMDPEYYQEGSIACVGLSGTFNPHSFCEATHHSANHAQCCNMQNISFDHLDEMMDGARFSADVLGDPDERASRYDEIWHEILELCGNSYTHIGLSSAVMNREIRGFNMWPFNEGILSYGLYAPVDDQVSYLDRDA